MLSSTFHVHAVAVRLPFDSRPSPSSEIARNAGEAYFLQLYCKKSTVTLIFLFNDFNKDNASFQ